MYGQQVAGYVEVREGGFTFATVHGSGHMAPQFKPQQTYHAIFNFINNVPLWDTPVVELRLYSLW